MDEEAFLTKNVYCPRKMLASRAFSGLQETFLGRQNCPERLPTLEYMKLKAHSPKDKYCICIK